MFRDQLPARSGPTVRRVNGSSDNPLYGKRSKITSPPKRKFQSPRDRLRKLVPELNALISGAEEDFPKEILERLADEGFGWTWQLAVTWDEWTGDTLGDPSPLFVIRVAEEDGRDFAILMQVAGAEVFDLAYIDDTAKP